MKFIILLSFVFLTMSTAQDNSTKKSSAQGQPQQKPDVSSNKGKSTTKLPFSLSPTPRSTTKKRNSTIRNFDEWKKSAKKMYASKTEEETAAKVYAASAKSINEHNKQKNVTYQQDTNENSDKTYDEKKATIMGAKKPEERGRRKRSIHDLKQKSAKNRNKREEVTASYSQQLNDSLDFR